MSVCIFDNPKTMRRECWRNGRLELSYSFEHFIPGFEPIPANYLRFEANVGPWKTGQIFGDPAAIQDEPSNDGAAVPAQGAENAAMPVQFVSYSPDGSMSQTA